MNRSVPWLLGLTCAVALGGCSGNDPEPATSSGAAANSPTAGSPVATPASAAPFPVASISATPPVSQGQLRGFNPPTQRSLHNLTVDVGEVRTSQQGTRLTFWVTSTKSEPLPALYAWDTPSWPVLTEPSTHRIDSVSTWGSGKSIQCVCSGPTLVDTFVRPMYALYPPLPDNITSVQVSIPGAPGSVTVPVTR